MIKSDYHSHTSYSFDSKASVDSMVMQAIELGLEEICFTDHIDFTYPECKIVSPYGIAANIAAIRDAAQRYKGQIRLPVGVEIGLRPDCAKIADELVVAHNFDFVIGSVHEIDGIDFYYYPELYENNSKQQAYNRYFEATLQALQVYENYDVLGHMDYVERYAVTRGHYADTALEYKNHKELIDAILRILIDRGKGIEINTSGLAYGLNRTHPQSAIVARYAEMGGEIITIGSDAHSPRMIAYGFDVVQDMLESLGIRYIARFEGRRAVMVGVDS